VSGLRWTSGSAASDGEDIYFESTGDADESVVLCHGLGGNHAVWFQQVPVLAQDFRVITWDQRGFGRSSNRAGASGPAAAVRDLGAICDQLGLGRVHLVGQSMGGWCVLGFALASPERVRSLVIADSTAGVVNDTIMDALVTTARREIPAEVTGAHPAIGERLTTQDPVKAFLYQQIGSFRGDITDADMVSTLFSTRYDLSAVQALGLPTLCVVGSKDDLIPPVAVREVARILGAELVEIEGAGHSPYFEEPDAWNEAVRSFLSQRSL
jgi:3-oxoadipate enol-lactonase